MSSQFDRVTVYDAPALTVSQLLGGQTSLSNAIDTWLNGGVSLAPLARRDFRKKIHSMTGDTAVGNAIVNLATNPFVIASILLTPSVGRGAKHALGSARIFSGRMENSILPAWLRSASQIADGTAGSTAMAGLSDATRNLKREFSEHIREPERNLIAHLFGVKPDEVTEVMVRQFNNPRHRKRAPEEVQDRINRFWTAFAAHHAKLDVENVTQRYKVVGRDITYKDPSGNRVPLTDPNMRRQVITQFGEDIKNAERRTITVYKEGSEFTLEDVNISGVKELQEGVADRTAPFLLHGTPMKVIESLGPEAVAYSQALSEAMQVRLGRMLFKNIDKDTSTEEILAIMNRARESGDIQDFIDETKVENLWKGMSRTGHMQSGHDMDNLAISVFGADIRRRLIRSRQAQELEEIFRAEHMKKYGEPVEDLVQKKVRARMGDHYLESDARMTQQEFSTMLRQAAAANVDLNRYLPRNVTEIHAARGKFVIDDITGENVFVPDPRTPRQQLSGEDLGGVGTRRVREQGGVSGRGRTRVTSEVMYHPDDLENLIMVFGDEALHYDQVPGKPGHRRSRIAEAARKTDAALNAAAQHGRGAVPISRIAPQAAVSKFEAETARDIAAYVTKIDDATLEHMRWIFSAENPQSREWDIDIGGDTTERSLTGDRLLADGAERSTLRDLTDGSDTQFVSYADVLDQTHDMIRHFDRKHMERTGRLKPGDPFESANARMFRTTIIPAALGNKNTSTLLSEHASLTIQNMVARSLETKLIQRLLADDRMAPIREFFERVADMEPASFGRKTESNVTGLLYSSHLGLNVGSVFLNVLQPFMHLSTYGGAWSVLRAYPNALDDLRRYMKVRWSRPEWRKLNIDGETRRQIAKEAGIEHWEEAGILGELMEDIDALTYKEGFGQGTEGAFRFWAMDLPLKLFEKGEWLNRLVAAHTVANRAVRAADNGITRAADGTLQFSRNAERIFLSNEIRRTVHETQFGSDLVNTPAIFLGPDQSGNVVQDFVGSWLSSPLMRQFMTFMVRTPVTMLEMPLKIAGREVEDVHHHFKRRYMKWLGRDIIRTLGIGATVYEVGKAMNVDLYRSTFYPAAWDLVGGSDRWMEPDPYEQSLPVRPPPFLGISMQYLQGVFGGDGQILGNAIARSVPGGVAMQRALGFAPQAEGTFLNKASLGALGTIQRNYVDYRGALPDGRVPYFKGDGTLIDYRPRTNIILKALGVPLESHPKAQEMDRWLSNNRQEIVQLRSRFMDAVMNNNHSLAQEMRRQFEDKFKIPLTVSKAQLRARMDSRTISRPERMINRLPPDVRPQFIEALAGARRMGINSQTLKSGPTVSSRDSRPTPGGGDVTLDPRILELLKEAAKDEKTRRAIEEGEIAPFRSY